MFGLFRKKKTLAFAYRADAQTKELLERTAAMLDLQLALCKRYRDYSRQLKSEYARGYILGFFDAALQYANVPVESDDAFFVLMGLGHAYLFEGDSEKGGRFALDSLALQENETFSGAMKVAGEEYFAYMGDSKRSPRKLQGFFLGV